MEEKGHAASPPETNQIETLVSGALVLDCLLNWITQVEPQTIWGMDVTRTGRYAGDDAGLFDWVTLVTHSEQPKPGERMVLEPDIIPDVAVTFCVNNTGKASRTVSG